MYVLRRNDQSGGYVARQGNKASYTKNKKLIRVYPTAEAAYRDRCPDNEEVLALKDITK